MLIDHLWSSKEIFDKHFSRPEATKVRETTARLWLGVVAFITLTSSVAISLFVISIPCVVSTLPLASWFMIFAFTLTGMALLTLPFAINIALSTLLRIAFLIPGTCCFITLRLLPCIELVVWRY